MALPMMESGTGDILAALGGAGFVRLLVLILTPVLVLFCRRKLAQWLNAIIFLFFSNEKAGFNDYEDAVVYKGEVKKSKVIVFIRHGESDWNFIFNKNKLMLLPRLVQGFLRELWIFPTNSSVFIDSALSKKGVEQARTLQKHITESKVDGNTDRAAVLKVLRGDNDAQKSVIVSSNLRRAVQTGCIALWPRLSKTKEDGTKEKVVVLSTLQEMTRNVDTIALADKGELPDTSLLEQEFGCYEATGFDASKVLDVTQCTGSKALREQALPRQRAFCDWCFQRDEPVIVVSSGHSIWFRNFFKSRIPKDKYHHSKDKKMVNGGIVAFRLDQGDSSKAPSRSGYCVDVDSITTIYGGFEKVKEISPEKSEPRLFLDPAMLAATSAVSEMAASAARGNGRGRGLAYPTSRNKPAPTSESPVVNSFGVKQGNCAAGSPGEAGGYTVFLQTPAQVAQAKREARSAPGCGAGLRKLFVKRS